MMREKHPVRSIVALILGFIYVLPILIIVMNAFKPNRDIMLSFIQWPKSLYLDNFADAISAMDFATAMFNTIKITVFTVLLATFASFCAAYGIGHMRRKMSNTVYLFFVLGQLVPFHAVMIAVAMQATSLGLSNTHLGLILYDSGFFAAFGIITYVGFLKSVPGELEDAAAIDGCNAPRTMAQIVFPLVRPTTITLAVLFFLWTWNDYVLPNILISKNELRTITVKLFMFKTSTNAEWNLLMAGVTLSVIPNVLLYIFAQKYIVSGLTTGAVK